LFRLEKGKYGPRKSVQKMMSPAEALQNAAEALKRANVPGRGKLFLENPWLPEIISVEGV